MSLGTTIFLSSCLSKRKNSVRRQALSKQQIVKFICKASILQAWSGLTQGRVAVQCLWELGILSYKLGYRPCLLFPVFLLICMSSSSWCACFSPNLRSGYSFQWVSNSMLMTLLGYMWGLPSSISFSCSCLPSFFFYQNQSGRRSRWNSNLSHTWLTSPNI